MRAFRTWDPVSSGTNRVFDEAHACKNNKWFFDKSVWQKMFRTMGGCGFDAMVMANTHPFPFMIETPGYPEARMLDDSTLADYQRMHHWIFETALDYEIAPYLLFFSNYYPSRLLEARGIDPHDLSAPPDFALDYTRGCVRELLQSYTEIAGIFVDAGESSAQFIQQSVVDTLDAVRPDANLYLCGCDGEADDFVKQIKRRGSRPTRSLRRVYVRAPRRRQPRSDVYELDRGGRRVECPCGVSDLQLRAVDEFFIRYSRRYS